MNIERTRNRLKRALVARYGFAMLGLSIRWKQILGVLMPGPDMIKVTHENKLLILTLDNPPVNALSQRLLKEFEAALDAANQDSNVRALILTGAGQSAFIAGADIREFTAIRSKKEATELALKGQALFKKVEDFPKPVIAAINGVCLGGGNELAMACHLRIASDRARFGQPEINLGIIPGFGGTQRLLRLVGPARAAEIVLTGDMLSAKEAERIGLINKAVPDGDELKIAKGIANKIAAKGRVAVKKSLQAIMQGKDLHLEKALKLEAELFADTAETQDMKEGVQAFLEKRRPEFKDR